MITLNSIGIHASSLVLPSGRMGLFSNEALVAVYDGQGLHRIEDLYRRPVSSLRHVQQWADQLGVIWESITSVAPRELERILLDT